MKLVVTIILIFAVSSNVAFALTQEEAEQKAYTMMVRVWGIYSSTDETFKKDLAALIVEGKIEDAAMRVMRDGRALAAVNRLYAPMMSEKEVRDPGYSAGMALAEGLFRDGEDQRKFWYANIRYNLNIAGLAAPSRQDNNHYAVVDAQKITPATRANLLIRVDDQWADIAAVDKGGVFTLVGHPFTAGTNRGAIRWGIKYCLGRPIEEMRDNLMSAGQTLRDVNAEAALTQGCYGCHAAVDRFVRVFATFDYDNQNRFQIRTTVDPKFNRNVGVYPDGEVMGLARNFVNTFATRDVAGIGWRGAQQGVGVSEFGAMLANTKAHSRHMAKSVFEEVCRQKAEGADLIAALDRIAVDNYEARGYVLRDLYSKILSMDECTGGAGGA